ncbi:MAG: type II secretion system protein [Candidatus Omnitrophica bacterium]|nr:type II secretion system protein [Candidatus Omnitrophota bacterium]
MFLRLRSSKGFTILELLIVIAVIAILVGIALPRFKGMKDEGNYAKAKGELRSLQTAAESYRIHHSGYPADLASATLNAASPQILAAAPKDAFDTANDYTYFISTNGLYYVILSKGPGGTTTVTAITDVGALTGATGDDIWVSNGTIQSGG